MPTRSNVQLGRVFGIRIGASTSWFVVLFFLIYYLSKLFHELLGGSQTTSYAIAVAGALGYFASLVLHELGHAVTARRQGIPITGIDLWFLGGLSQMKREPQNAREELLVAIAGPAVTLVLLMVCVGVSLVLPGSGRVNDLTLGGEGQVSTTPALALVGWLGFINAMLLVFNLVPAFPLDGGRIARAIVWWRTGDRNRATRAAGRSGQGFSIGVGLLGIWQLLVGEPYFGLATMLIAFFIYTSASAAIAQGVIGRRIQSMTVGDIMDREPVTIPSDVTLLDAQEQFFLRYRWPWFAVVDPTRHFLGIVRGQRVAMEIEAGRPALEIGDVMENDAPVAIGEEAPLESLLGSEGLGRLGAMVAVDSDGVLQGVVTLAELRRALSPAT